MRDLDTKSNLFNFPIHISTFPHCHCTAEGAPLLNAHEALGWKLFRLVLVFKIGWKVKTVNDDGKHPNVNRYLRILLY